MTALDAAAATARVPDLPPILRRTRFSGSAAGLRRIVTRGSILLALTLGIYRFWLTTDIRRFLWGHTEIDGESLEYNGTPVELLLGFLIAIALLVPLYVGFFFATLSLGPLAIVVSALNLPLLAYLTQYALFRARRYRLSRTLFRGIRFQQDGSPIYYGFLALGLWTLAVVTLGLAYPFARTMLERYKMEHTRYGDRPCRFAGTAGDLFARGFPLWALVAAPLLLALWFAITSVEWGLIAMLADDSVDLSEFATRLEEEFPEVYVAIGTMVIGLTATIVMAMALLPAFQALLARWWLSGLQVGAMRVRTRLPTRAVYGAWLRFLLYAAGLLLMLLLVAGVGSAMLGGISAGKREVASAFGLLGLYVLGALGLAALYQVTVMLTVWRQGIDHAEITGLTTLDDVRAEGVPVSAVGEGLADALGVGGIA